MNVRSIKRIVQALLLGTVWLASGSSFGQAGYDLEDFKLRSAQDLVDVCTLDSGHEHYEVARAFCFGFFEGAMHYDNAMGDSEIYADLVCQPEGVTRSEAVAVVMAYLQANPQYGSEAPIDASFRALTDKWPCPA